MDSLYIGDIPLENKFFSRDDEGNILLFVSPFDKPTDTDIKVYRLFNLQDGKLIYDTLTSDVATLLTRNVYEISVTNKWYDRGDSLTILSFTCCIAVCILFITNIFTSIFKKGGLLGGLF